MVELISWLVVGFIIVMRVRCVMELGFGMREEFGGFGEGREERVREERGVAREARNVRVSVRVGMCIMGFFYSNDLIADRICICERKRDRVKRWSGKSEKRRREITSTGERYFSLALKNFLIESIGICSLYLGIIHEKLSQELGHGMVLPTVGTKPSLSLPPSLLSIQVYERQGQHPDVHLRLPAVRLRVMLAVHGGCTTFAFAGMDESGRLHTARVHA